MNNKPRSSLWTTNFWKELSIKIKSVQIQIMDCYIPLHNCMDRLQLVNWWLALTNYFSITCKSMALLVASMTSSSRRRWTENEKNSLNCFMNKLSHRFAVLMNSLRRKISTTWEDKIIFAMNREIKNSQTEEYMFINLKRSFDTFNIRLSISRML